MNEEANTLQTPELPYLIDRIKALTIDSLVMIILAYFISVLFDSIGYEGETFRIIAISLVLLYEPLLTSTSATLGQLITGIRVRRFKDMDTKISIQLALVRFVIKMTLGWISLLTVTYDKNKRAIHDMVASSIVIIK